MIRESEDHQKVFEDIEKLAANLKPDNFVALTSGYGLGEVRFNSAPVKAPESSTRKSLVQERPPAKQSTAPAPARPRRKAERTSPRKLSRTAGRLVAGFLLFLVGISSALLLAAKFHAMAPWHLARQIEARQDMQIGFLCWVAGCAVLHWVIFRLVRSPNLG